MTNEQSEKNIFPDQVYKYSLAGECGFNISELEINTTNNKFYLHIVSRWLGGAVTEMTYRGWVRVHTPVYRSLHVDYFYINGNKYQVSEPFEEPNSDPKDDDEKSSSVVFQFINVGRTSVQFQDDECIGLGIGCKFNIDSTYTDIISLCDSENRFIHKLFQRLLFYRVEE
jgi:hypothetical protein